MKFNRQLFKEAFKVGYKAGKKRLNEELFDEYGSFPIFNDKNIESSYFLTNVIFKFNINNDIINKLYKKPEQILENYIYENGSLPYFYCNVTFNFNSKKKMPTKPPMTSIKIKEDVKKRVQFFELNTYPIICFENEPEINLVSFSKYREDISEEQLYKSFFKEKENIVDCFEIKIGKPESYKNAKESVDLKSNPWQKRKV